MRSSLKVEMLVAPAEGLSRRDLSTEAVLRTSNEHEREIDAVDAGSWNLFDHGSAALRLAFTLAHSGLGHASRTAFIPAG
jgi:hypothetical protein